MERELYTYVILRTTALYTISNILDDEIIIV